MRSLSGPGEESDEDRLTQIVQSSPPGRTKALDWLTGEENI